MRAIDRVTFVINSISDVTTTVWTRSLIFSWFHFSIFSVWYGLFSRWDAAGKDPMFIGFGYHPNSDELLCTQGFLLKICKIFGVQGSVLADDVD